MIELGIIDIEGEIRTRTFFSNEVKELEKGFGFDGSSLGLAPIEDSDLIAIPDMKTLKSYKLSEESIDFYLCNIMKNGRPYYLDLRKFISDYMKSYPYRVEVGPEIEFYIKEGPHERNDCYMRPYPFDREKALIRKLLKNLNELGYGPRLEHSEVGEGQHEIVISPSSPEEIADKIAFYKYYLRLFFAEYGKSVTFLPKPYKKLNGSGMHLHISLKRKDGSRISFTGDGEGKSFIAGVLKYIPEITIFLNPHENSYERLVPGFEAPVYISWGRGNRSALIRIPNYRNEDRYRVELRSPDPMMNPYIGLPAILEAGRVGIEEGLDLEEEAYCNVYKCEKYRKKRLPVSELEAISLAEKSKIVGRLGKVPLEFINFKKRTMKKGKSYKFRWSKKIL